MKIEPKLTLRIFVLLILIVVIVHYIFVRIGFNQSEIDILNLIVSTLGFIFVIYQINLLEKSISAQAYQNVLSNYLKCTSEGDSVDPLYRTNYFPTQDIKDIRMFIIMMNTFEMLLVLRKNNLIGNDVWEPWKEYFIKFIKLENFRNMWIKIKDERIYHEDLKKLIDAGIA